MKNDNISEKEKDIEDKKFKPELKQLNQLSLVIKENNSFSEEKIKQLYSDVSSFISSLDLNTLEQKSYQLIADKLSSSGLLSQIVKVNKEVEENLNNF
jgi:hypothetical protein